MDGEGAGPRLPTFFFLLFLCCVHTIPPVNYLLNCPFKMDNSPRHSCLQFSKEWSIELSFFHTALTLLWSSLFLSLPPDLPSHCVFLLSVSSTERARQSWRTSRQGLLFCRFTLWMPTRAPMAGSHTASCTKTPLCRHSAYTLTLVLEHTHTSFHFHKHTHAEKYTYFLHWVLITLSSSTVIDTPQQRLLGVLKFIHLTF